MFPSRAHVTPAHSSATRRRRRLASPRLRLAIAGPALALALAGGLAGPWSAGAGHSATSAASAAQIGARTGASRSVALDAFASHGANPAASGGSGTGGGGNAKARRHRATARAIARRMLRRFHWAARRQFRYLNRLWDRESGWNVYAENPYSAAYGIPQAVPGSKMSSAGPNWQSNARTQIRWGLRYIRSRYGSPRRAWDHEIDSGWY